VAVANEKTLHDLEFDRLKDVVKEYASSSLGQESVASLDPLTDRETIEQGMAEVSEAISYLNRYSRFSLGGVEDIAPLLAQAEEQSFLSGESLLLVLRTIDATQQIRTRLTTADEVDVIKRYAARLFDGSSLAKRIRRAIDEGGEVRDDASPALRDLTRKQRTLEARIEKKLRATIDRNPELISEPVLTRRNGRLVIPIKSGAIGQMEAIVHDRSATGQTLYAEPSALVPDNNALAQLSGEIRDERVRILRELSKAFVEKRAPLLRDRSILAHLDSLFARASYAISNRCAFPRLSTRIALQDARHPLLNVDRVVPISLSMGGSLRMAVITGPNTGGKTVTLKTIGLMTLMTQAIIPIPASPDSEIRIVSKIRSDIGDEQSISQNLSTFSAHMKNIVTILREADDDSLILLDELGAGTDPQEGAALGLSIIEALLESEALVAISTHLTPLKFFAIRHPEVKTASMEFDVRTLSPTFRVVEGVPGKSNAFVIAERLGLSSDLVNRARSFLSKGEIRAEDIIEELQRERQTMIRHRQKAEQELAAAERMKQAYREKIEAFEQEKEGTLSSRTRELDTFLRNSQAHVENLLAQLNATRDDEAARAAYRELVRIRQELQQKDTRVGDTRVGDTRVGDVRVSLGKESAQASSESLRVGQTVHVRSLDADGQVMHILPHGKVAVDLAGVRLLTDIKDIEPSKGRKRDRAKAESHQAIRTRSSSVPLQLNVRGMTVAEAMRDVEIYLDQLLLADIKHASILHGKGTGALRDAIRDYLSSSSLITSCGAGTPREGGDGITVFTIGGD